MVLGMTAVAGVRWLVISLLEVVESDVTTFRSLESCKGLYPLIYVGVDTFLQIWYEEAFPRGLCLQSVPSPLQALKLAGNAMQDLQLDICGEA